MKKVISYSWSLISLIVIIFIMSGCTRSISVTYNADMTRLTNADAINNLSLGVAKFEDKRSWVDKSDAKSESYVGKAGMWKFGMTYENKDYIPVKDIVQSIFVKEFRNAGINAKPIDHVLSKQNISDFGNMSEQDKVDYILGGEVEILNFFNDVKAWTVTSKRTVYLKLIMVKVNGQEVRLDAAFNNSDSENEGSGVLHSTNVDKLINKVVKKVVSEVIKQVAAKMALNDNDFSWKIVFNGKTYEFVPDLS